MIFLISAIIGIAFVSNGQTIQPPAGFKLIKPDGVNRQINHYIKDGYTFMSDGWTGPLPKDRLKFDANVAQFLSENYRTSLANDVHFSDGIYYGVAHYSGNYVFTVLDNETVYKFTSKTKDANFEKYSSWLLNEAKKHSR